MKNISERFKEFLDYKKNIGITQQKLSDITGIGRSTLSELGKGIQEPSSETLLKLIRKTDINLNWLLTGDGSMIREESPAIDKPQAEYSIPPNCPAGYVCQQICEVCKELPPKGQEHVLKAAESVLALLTDFKTPGYKRESKGRVNSKKTA
jgi:transcriptional regulator with XRE-family HTH domain